MELEWYESEGTQEVAPAPVNLDWSEVLVYLHRNVERVTKEDPVSGETYEVWQYEEAVLSRADYAIYLAELAESNVEYLAIMTDVDLDV